MPARHSYLHVSSRFLKQITVKKQYCKMFLKARDQKSVAILNSIRNFNKKKT